MQVSDTQDPKQEVVRFFITAFLWSWLLWLPRFLASAGWINLPELVDLFLAIAAFLGPAFAAFCLTRTREGKEAAADLWRRGWKLNFEKFWLIPAVLIMPAIGGLSVLALILLGEEIPWEYSAPLGRIVPVFLLACLSAIGQEYGWRGYALPRMQTILTPLKASLLLGALWGLWYLPLHFISGSMQAAIPVWHIILQAAVISVLYTWLVNRTGGSVLMAIVFHASGYLSAAYLPAWENEIGRWILLLLIVTTIFGLAVSAGYKRYKAL